jgi:metal-responsive CopG/Arc/MetJ family transcriptional regulator
MVKQEKSVHKKMGRPVGRTYRETIPVRLTEDAITAIDAWIDQQVDEISRSEAIRRLIERGLKYKGK